MNVCATMQSFNAVDDQAFCRTACWTLALDAQAGLAARQVVVSLKIQFYRHA